MIHRFLGLPFILVISLLQAGCSTPNAGQQQVVLDQEISDLLKSRVVNVQSMLDKTKFNFTKVDYKTGQDRLVKNHFYFIDSETNAAGSLCADRLKADDFKLISGSRWFGEKRFELAVPARDKLKECVDEYVNTHPVSDDSLVEFLSNTTIQQHTRFPALRDQLKRAKQDNILTFSEIIRIYQALDGALVDATNKNNKINNNWS